MKTQTKYKAKFDFRGVNREELIVAVSQESAQENIETYYKNASNINITEL